MTTFLEARAFLLKHRTDYEAAVRGFRWPDPVPFNWALDWFDELAKDADAKGVHGKERKKFMSACKKAAADKPK